MDKYNSQNRKQKKSFTGTGVKRFLCLLRTLVFSALKGKETETRASDTEFKKKKKSQSNQEATTNKNCSSILNIFFFPSRNSQIAFINETDETKSVRSEGLKRNLYFPGLYRIIQDSRCNLAFSGTLIKS